jgi:leucyl aminopeptidase
MSCDNLCFSPKCTDLKCTDKIIPIEAVSTEDFESYFAAQSENAKAWLQNISFSAKSGEVALIPQADGSVAKVLVGLGAKESFWSYAGVAAKLPAGCYQISAAVGEFDHESRALAWALGCYRFSAYKFKEPIKAKLCVAASVDRDSLEDMISSIYLVRDLVNTPAGDLGPEELAAAVRACATEVGAEYSEIVGKDLLTENFPMIYHVGRGADRAPRLAMLTWGEAHNPLLAIVGKGVCFDSGGLQIKSASGMLDMKKDMGGAAHAIALARLIIKANLPVRVRLLVPCVENATSGSAYHPRDVLPSRDGITVEVNNTDAEGRLVLADALTSQIEHSPEVLIDFATLTGAGRVALGPDIPALFANSDALQQDIWQTSKEVHDLVWPLPLYSGYESYIDSGVADLSNSSSLPYGGAITAGLFLQRFVPKTLPWMHFDLMAGNIEERAGRPKGGDAQALRTVFAWCKKKFAN